MRQEAKKYKRQYTYRLKDRHDPADRMFLSFKQKGKRNYTRKRTAFVGTKAIHFSILSRAGWRGTKKYLFIYSGILINFFSIFFAKKILQKIYQDTPLSFFSRPFSEKSLRTLFRKSPEKNELCINK